MFFVSPLYDPSRKSKFNSRTVEEFLEDMQQENNVSKDLLCFRVGGKEISLSNLPVSTSLEETGIESGCNVEYWIRLNGSAPLDVTSFLTLIAGLFLIGLGFCFYIILGVMLVILYYCMRLFGCARVREASPYDDQIEEFELEESNV